MNQLIERLLLQVPELGTRNLTEDDFDRICEDKGISVITHAGTNSMYIRTCGRDIIAVAKDLRGESRLFTLFHELGHALIHGGQYPNRAYFHNMKTSKEETEADIFAFLAIGELTIRNADSIYKQKC
jgi:Zn-dependent peptidase ImmA (M78 family)